MRALKIVVILLMPVVFYVVYWQHQYQRSKSDADKFCAAMEIGSDVATAGPRAEAMGVPPFRHGFRDEKKIYAATFTGPIFNAFTCELTVADGRIAAKRVTELND
jgi:hypothetical protein